MNQNRDDLVVAAATYKIYGSLFTLIWPLAAIAIVGLAVQFLFAKLWPAFIPLAVLAWIWLLLILRHRARGAEASPDPRWLVWISTRPLKNAIWTTLILTGLVWQLAPKSAAPSDPARPTATARP
jgi:hypothetical protein